MTLGHLNCSEALGTRGDSRKRDAVPGMIESQLGDFVRRFAQLQKQLDTQDSPQDGGFEGTSPEFTSLAAIASAGENFTASEHARTVFTQSFAQLQPAMPKETAVTRRGDFRLLHVDRLAIPHPGEAATTSLVDNLETDCPILQPATLLGIDPPLRETLDWVRARAHSHPGHWP